MMNTNKRKSPMKPFSIDYAAKTIVLTKPFAQRASVPGSTEYRQIAALHRDYADFDFTLRTIRKAQNRPSTRGLSAAAMKEYVLVTCGEGSPEYAEYARQESISKACPNPYMYMRRWFMAHYPDWARVSAPAAEAEREEEC